VVENWLTNLLANYGNVVGSWIVKSVVEYARKCFPILNLFVRLRKLLIKGKISKYDLIVTSEVIEHIPDHSKESLLKILVN
jgi:2-polyprenyl-3-methyl-5-hydroxy-6-metoxy-1,4-benzoquinol methylase